MSALMTCDDGVSRLVSVIVGRAEKRVQQTAGALGVQGWLGKQPSLMLHAQWYLLYNFYKVNHSKTISKRIEFLMKNKKRVNI